MRCVSLRSRPRPAERRGGGAVVTPAGERLVGLYRTIESHARSAAGGEFRAIGRLVRPERVRDGASA